MDDIISLSDDSDTDSVLSTTTSSDVFYIYRPSGTATDDPFPSYTSQPASVWLWSSNGESQTQKNTRDPFEFDEVGKGLKNRLKSDNGRKYVKHSNLDTKELSLAEQVHLRRVHYLTLGNGVRLLLILLCFGWFIFNAYTVFNDYLRHENTVFMEFRSPNYTPPPAITICTENILANYKIPNSLLETLKVSDVFAGKKFKQYFQRDSENVECLFTYSTISDSSSYKIINCSELVPILVSIQEGRRCMTFFSDVYGEMSALNRTRKDRAQFDFESFPSIRLVIFGGALKDDREQLWPVDQRKDSTYDMTKEMSTTGLSMALHDPTQIHYMHDLPMHSIPPGKYLDSRFSKKLEEFNPNSGCFPYLRDQLKSPDYSVLLQTEDEASRNKDAHLSEYRSRGECFSYCISRLLNSRKCVNPYSVLTKDIVERDYFYQSLEATRNRDVPPDKLDSTHPRQLFCPNSNDSLTAYLFMKTLCLISCPSACSTESYDMDTNFVTENYVDNVTVIEIQWSPEPVTFISHLEKFDNSEFIGNLGGHAHIWLGVSVIHVVRYFISLIRNGHFVGRRNRSFCQRWLWAICHRD